MQTQPAEKTKSPRKTLPNKQPSGIGKPKSAAPQTVTATTGNSAPTPVARRA
jgi:hypothetical protein